MLKMLNASASLLEMDTDDLATDVALHEVGDPDLAPVLQSLRNILAADTIRVQAVLPTGRLGGVLAGVNAGPAIQDEVFDSVPLEASERGASIWLPSTRAAGAFHLSLIETQSGQQLALLARPARGGAVGRLAIERKMPFCLPLVEWALSRWLRERERRTGSDEQLAVLDLFGCGVLLIDAECHILGANIAARAAFAQSSVISDRGERFTLSCIDDAMRFQVLLQHALFDPDKGPVIAVVGRHGQLPIMLSIRAVRNGRRMAGNAVVQVIDPGAALSLPLDSLARHYGWTPVECRLIEQIVLGKTLGEAAVAMRLKEQTARTYLKHIFQKTGLRRQLELVRLVLAGSTPKSHVACNGAGA